MTILKYDICPGARPAECRLSETVLVRYTIAAQREVLARLLQLNHERYEEEVKMGLHEKQKNTEADKLKNAKHRRSKKIVEQDELF